jgi:hypothetical protein
VRNKLNHNQIFLPDKVTILQIHLRSLLIDFSAQKKILDWMETIQNVKAVKNLHFISSVMVNKKDDEIADINLSKFENLQYFGIQSYGNYMIVLPEDIQVKIDIIKPPEKHMFIYKFVRSRNKLYLNLLKLDTMDIIENFQLNYLSDIKILELDVPKDTDSELLLAMLNKIVIGNSEHLKELIVHNSLEFISRIETIQNIKSVENIYLFSKVLDNQSEEVIDINLSNFENLIEFGLKAHGKYNIILPTDNWIRITFVKPFEEHHSLIIKFDQSKKNLQLILLEKLHTMSIIENFQLTFPSDIIKTLEIDVCEDTDSILLVAMLNKIIVENSFHLEELITNIYTDIKFPRQFDFSELPYARVSKFTVIFYDSSTKTKYSEPDQTILKSQIKYS